MSPYNLHDIAIKPTEASDVDYENHIDRFVLYLGNLPVVRRKANSVTILIGRVVKSNGEPVGLTAIKSAVQLGVTDAAGYFQLDYKGEKIFKLSKEGPVLCKVDMVTAMLSVNAQSAFAEVGDIVCE